MSLGLLIDTSMLGVSLAICDFGAGKELKWKYSHPQQYGSAVMLSQLYQQGLKETGLHSRDISKLLVSNGPGSFTGIKIGLSWAYGLGIANPEIEWQAVSSLAATAYHLSERDGKNQPLIVFLPSTKTHGYMACMEPLSGKVKTSLVQAEHDEGPYGSLLKLSTSARIYWAGQWDKMQAYLSTQGIEQVSLTPSQLLEAGVYGMLKLAINNQINAWSKQFPTPNYLRKSTAEERLEAQKKGALLNNEKVN
ncbi:MAG: hypothetical protein AB8G05_16145 [Oligoflexales bacterium]